MEEILRYDGSVHSGVRRFAAEDLVIGGTHISAGDAVLVSIAGANQDPDCYPEPRTMDFSRDLERHLAFGIGTHHCIGAELARTEITMALETLLRRFPRGAGRAGREPGLAAILRRPSPQTASGRLLVLGNSGGWADQGRAGWHAGAAFPRCRSPDPRSSVRACVSRAFRGRRNP